MKIAVQVPVKTTPSERVENKNFRLLDGIPLWAYTIRELVNTLPHDWDIYLDTDNVEDDRFCGLEGYNVQLHKRPPWYGTNEANGNHLLTQFGILHPEYDIYVQKFITAPFLGGSTLQSMVAEMTLGGYDSAFTCQKRKTWAWMEGKPLNFGIEPNGLPRSQDRDIEIALESTGTYAITREALFKYCCRVGQDPYMCEVNDIEALDIDTEADFERAEDIASDEPGSCFRRNVDRRI